jgi:hypothetical protein
VLGRSDSVKQAILPEKRGSIGVSEFGGPLMQRHDNPL